MAWSSRWFQFAVLLFLAFVWGSSFILMKIGLKSFSPQQAAGIRIFTAFIVLLPYSIKSLKSLKRKDLKSILIAGFIGSLIPAFLFTKAQTRIDSSLAGMLNSLTPVFTLIVGILFHRTKIRWLQIVGLVLGLLGAVGLIFLGNNKSFGPVNNYAFFIITATICYALNVNEVKTKLTHLNGIQITSLSFLFIGPVAFIFLITSDIKPVLENDNWHLHLSALATLGIVGTAFAMLIMNSLIRHISAVYAASVTYIIPIFAIMWGLIDGERLGVLHFGFMSLVLLGVFLINKRR